MPMTPANQPKANTVESGNDFPARLKEAAGDRISLLAGLEDAARNSYESSWSKLLPAISTFLKSADGQALVRALAVSPEAKTRRFVAAGLVVWQLDEERSLNVLRWLMTDRDISVAKAAAQAMGGLAGRKRQVWNEIEDMAAAASPKSRMIAAWACTRHAQPVMLRTLQTLSADPNEDVRVAAAEAWRQALSNFNDKAWPVFAEMASPKVKTETTHHAETEDEWQVRHTSALTLLEKARELSPDEAALMARLLNDAESKVRITAVRVLAAAADIYPELAMRTLMPLARGEDAHRSWEEREAAIPGLAKLPYQEAGRFLPLVERLASDSNLRIATAAARTIGQLTYVHPEWSLSVINRIAATSDDFAASLKRLACARGLTGAEPPYKKSVLPLLEQFLADRDPEVRTEAVAALVRLAASHPDPAMNLLSQLSRQDNDSASWEIRRTAARALELIAPLHPNRTLGLLERLAGDANGFVRQAVAQALQEQARQAPEKTLSALLEMAVDKSWEKKATVALVLSEPALHFTDKPFQALKRLAGDADNDTRDAAFFSLGMLANRLPGIVLPVLERLVQSRKGVTAWKTAQGLAETTDVFSIEVVPLIESLAKDKEIDVQQAAASAVINMARWMPEEALGICQRWDIEKSHHLRAARLNILGIAAFCGNARAVSLLKGQMTDEDEESRADAVRVWGELRFVLEKQSLDALYSAEKDDDWVVRESASHALGARGWIKPKKIIQSLNQLTDDREFAAAFAASAVWDAIGFQANQTRLGDDESSEIVTTQSLFHSRFVRYRQSRLDNYLTSLLVPQPLDSEKERGGFQVQRLPGDVVLPTTMEFLIDDSEAFEQLPVRPSGSITLSEQTRPGLSAKAMELAKRFFKWLFRRLFRSEVEIRMSSGLTDGGEAPPQQQGVQLHELKRRLRELLLRYANGESYSLSEIERLVQLMPRPLLFYALYRGAQLPATRRIARLGYDLASLVEKAESANLVKGEAQTKLRGQLPDALDEFLNRCSRLQDGQRDLYVGRFSWMREALTVTALEQIPLLLARPIQGQSGSKRNHEWLERSRKALRQAMEPLRSLDANTPADVKTFLLLRCTIGLEEATRTVSAEAWEPDRTILLQALTAWRELISEESQRSQSGARLEIIVPDRVPPGEITELTVKIINHGPSPVSNLHLQVTGRGFVSEDFFSPTLPLLTVGQAHTYLVRGRAWFLPKFPITCILRYNEPRRENLKLQHSVEITVESDSPSQVWEDIRNPYVAGTPLKPGKHDNLFVGRTDIFDFLYKQLVEAGTPRPVVLHGRRRMGKTSVMMWLPTKLPTQYHVVYIDLQATEILSGAAQHLQYLASTIFRTLPEKPDPVAVDLKAYQENPAFQFEQVFLPELERMLAGKRLVLAVDEFQVFEEKIKRGDLEAGFVSFLRYWVQRGDVSFVFVGTRSTKDFDHEIWSALFNPAISKEIDLLSSEEARQVMTSPLGVDVYYDDPALDLLEWLTGHHPFFVQRLCSEVVEELNRRRQRRVNVSIVEAATRQLVKSGSMQLRFLWDEMKGAQRAVIASINEEMTLNASRQARWEDVWKWMSTVNPNVPQDEFQQVTHELEKRGLIVDESGTLRFALGLLPAYLTEYIPTRETKERIFELW